MAEFDRGGCATVQERLAAFYREFPEGSVRTFLVKLEGPEVVFEARVYRTPEEVAMGVCTSGWARAAEGPADEPGRLESCESSAISRALANLGYTGDDLPGRAEVLRFARGEEQGRLPGAA